MKLEIMLQEDDPGLFRWALNVITEVLMGQKLKNTCLQEREKVM